jgi:ADP-heptose:LPS heptosyltransferase
MKITINSTDGLGDFVLRIPFFEALLDAGHALQIFMRPPAFELARALLPTARIENVNEDPCARLVRFRRNPFKAEIRKIAEFAPDLLVIAMFQQSFFDEVCLSKLPRSLKVAGFRCSDSFWSTQSNTPSEAIAEGFSIWADVKTDFPELEKNRLLASAILGFPLPNRPARITPPPKAIDDARATLRQRKISEGEYWVVCVGARPGLEMKDWGEENWAKALCQIAPEAKAPLLFLGNETEASSIEQIQAALPTDCVYFNLAKNPPPILTTLGIIALSAGFIGRDSGPMHLAAALLRPVLAIFSGTHWGRFIPESSGAIIISQKVPCQGCLGYCHLPEPFCVRRVTVEQFLEGWQLLRSQSVQTTRVIEIPMHEELRREIAYSAHLRFPRLAHEARRQVFEAGRSINLLDSAGIGIRLLARRNYRKRFSQRVHKMVGESKKE